ncbi:MAG TPA: hypothetical protein VMT46_00595 [Anaerolineaceae bacterium]|nr:hypothetical protein [Anaerolineaceae bacterium]
MLCQSCGIQVPERANYCWKCGKPMKPWIKLYEDTFLETCEIVFQPDDPSHGIGSFYAKAIGVFGVYVFGVSSGFQYDKIPDHQNSDQASKLDGLINRMVKAGWEPNGDYGEEWWNHRFQRRVKKTAKMPGAR